jgi:hypothetical protein
MDADLPGTEPEAHLSSVNTLDSTHASKEQSLQRRHQLRQSTNSLRYYGKQFGEGFDSHFAVFSANDKGEWLEDNGEEEE